MAEITKVSFRPFNKEGNNFKGSASVTLDDQLVLTGIRLVKGSKGLFINMPASYWESDEEYHDIFFPITKDFREELQEAVIEAYKEAKKDPGKGKKKSTSKKRKDEDDEEDD